jgi:outer membrane protein TolC
VVGAEKGDAVLMTCTIVTKAGATRLPPAPPPARSPALALAVSFGSALRKTAALAVAVACAGWVQAAPLPLADLLRTVEADPALAAESADLDAARSDRSALERGRGWQVIGSAGLGNYHELVVENVVANYRGRNLSMGVSHPLLGSLKRQADAIAASDFTVRRQQLQVALRQAERRLALRLAYADWWRAQQEQALCGPLQSAAKEAAAQLERRERAGWLLAADAGRARNDWQAALSPCATTANADTYRATLELLTQTRIPADATAVDEALTPHAAPFPDWQSLIEQHPRVASATSRVEEASGSRDPRWYDTIESNATLGYFLSDRAGVPDYGRSLVASINFSMPLDMAGVARDRRDAGEARYRAALARVDTERRNLLVELTQALRRHGATVQTEQQSEARMATAAEHWREQRLRQRIDSNPAMLLQLQAAERERYQAAFERIRAWHDWWTQEAALRLFTDDSPEAQTLLASPQRWQQATALADPAPTTTATLPRWEQGVYVWASDALLDGARQSAELEALQAAGMRRIYVGLNKSQVDALASTRSALRALLDAASSRGLRVSLLLGDPAWLTPAGRRQLTALIGQFKDLRFADLHLDLEVEQLGTPVPASRLRDWLDTLKAAAAASPWPVALSSHPRWFAAPAAGQPCVPCALPGLGIRDVSLMIYVRTPRRGAELSSGIARRWPKLSFRLAQSVEAELPAEESWAGTPRKQLDAQVDAWRAELSPNGITGIDWQDWRNYPRVSLGNEQPPSPGDEQPPSPEGKGEQLPSPGDGQPPSPGGERLPSPGDEPLLSTENEQLPSSGDEQPPPSPENEQLPSPGEDEQ